MSMMQSDTLDTPITPIVGGEVAGQGPGPTLLTADTLEGNHVHNTTGEHLGKIRDVMIDVPTGRVAYAVMASGGIMGMGGKLFALPWSALVLDADNHSFILDIETQRLENSPGFDKDHWPSTADYTFTKSVYDYYDLPPYWA